MHRCHFPEQFSPSACSPYKRTGFNALHHSSTNHGSHIFGLTNLPDFSLIFPVFLVSVLTPMYFTRALGKKKTYESQVWSVCIAKRRNVMMSWRQTPVVSMTTRLIFNEFNKCKNLFNKYTSIKAFFYLFGLHYPPHFDFGKSKKKSRLSKCWQDVPKIVPHLVFIKQWAFEIIKIAINALYLVF